MDEVPVKRAKQWHCMIPASAGLACSSSAVLAGANASAQPAVAFAHCVAAEFPMSCRTVVATRKQAPGMFTIIDVRLHFPPELSRAPYGLEFAPSDGDRVLWGLVLVLFEDRSIFSDSLRIFDRLNRFISGA